MLDLVFQDSNSDNQVAKALLTVTPLHNINGDLVSLPVGDRFFYRHNYLLSKPTARMLQIGICASGKYFDKHRYVGVAGREAFHIFDL